MRMIGKAENDLPERGARYEGTTNAITIFSSR